MVQLVNLDHQEHLGLQDLQDQVVRLAQVDRQVVQDRQDQVEQLVPLDQQVRLVLMVNLVVLHFSIDLILLLILV